MKESTINRNRPTYHKKVALYNSLVAFYKAMIINKLSDKQQAINDKIVAFDKGQTNTDTSVNHVTIFSADVINRLTPCHHRKARLYRLLVAFMDATLASQVENGVDPDTITATIVAYIPECYAEKIINSVAFPHLSDCVTTAIEEKRAPKPQPKPKKKYQVAVHATFAYFDEIVAESEEEACQIVYNRALHSSCFDWEFVDYNNEGIVTNSEDIDNED